MKILLPLITLALFTHAQAAGPVGKTYGGFSPKDKFKLKLIDNPAASVIALLGGSGPLDKIPAGFPDKKKGDKMKFKIGGKGELIIGNFSIPYDVKASSDTENVYTETATAQKPNINQAGLLKKNGKADFMNLALRRSEGSGTKLKVYQVEYLLD